MQPLIQREIGQGIDGDLEVARQKSVLQSLRGGVADLQRYTGMTRSDRAQKTKQEVWCDGAHKPEAELRLLKTDKLMRCLLGEIRTLKRLFQIGPHDPAELRQMRVGALAVEQRSAELLLQALDAARERGLSDI